MSRKLLFYQKVVCCAPGFSDGARSSAEVEQELYEAGKSRKANVGRPTRETEHRAAQKIQHIPPPKTIPFGQD